jgi:hypothetical protein
LLLTLLVLAAHADHTCRQNASGCQEA